MNRAIIAAALAITIGGMFASRAFAQESVTNINLGASGATSGFVGTYVWPWDTAGTSGNVGSGLVFSYGSTTTHVTLNQTGTVNLGGVALGYDPVVNTLLQAGASHVSGDTITVTFTNNLSQTDAFVLTSGNSFRYVYQAGGTGLGMYLQSLAGGDAGVTAQQWYYYNSGSQLDDLDAQTFTLPTSWQGTTLETMTIANYNGGSYNVGISALQVASLASEPSLPEPMSLAMFGVGCLGLMMVLGRPRLGRIC